MAVTQQRSDQLLAALDSAIPRHKYKTTIGVKTKGRGFARPTKASKLKQVTTQAPQRMLVDGAKCESVLMLKNLAKLLVDRIEAACAARITQVPNPKRNLNTAPPSRLLHGPSPGRNADQEVGNSQEYGSNVDVDASCAVSTEKTRSSSLGTQQLRDDNRSSQCIQETNRSCTQSDDASPNHGSSSIWETSESCRPNDSRSTSQPNPSGSSSIWETSESCRPNDSRPISQPNPSGSSIIWETSESCRPNDSRPISQPNPSGSSIIWETSESCRPNDSRPISQPNPSGSSIIWETSESCRPNDFRPRSQPHPSGSTSGGPNSRPSSRAPSRDWTGTPVSKVASLTSRMLTLKKVNVGLDDCEITPPKKGVHSTPGRKIRSPGLRSLVVPQVKNLPTPPTRTPANTKLVLSSSESMHNKAAEVVKATDESAQKGEKNEELYESVWADVVQNMFDEVFGDQPSHAVNKKQQTTASHQVSRPPQGSEEWIFQTQSIQYSYSTDRAARRGVHSSANVDKRYLTTAPPTNREPSNAARSKEGSSKAPVILPTLAKYHMDKIERYKKCVAEKQARDFQRDYSSRPSTAPDPYNVLNVYTERCLSQRSAKPPAAQKSSQHAHDWDGTRATNQPRSSIPAETCRAMSAGSIPLQHRPLEVSEMDRPHEKSINLRQETRAAVSELKERHSDVKKRTPSHKWFLHGAENDQSRNDLQAEIRANTEAVVSKKTRFMDLWPFLDRQIEAFIQAHILQCCILFKNIPPVFPTLEYQEEIQRLYSGHLLSTR